MPTTIHPSAIVDDGAQLGDGCRVWHFVHISAGARIGERCSFGQNVYVGNDVRIGDNVKIQNNVSVYDAVTLEDDVFCGPSMVFTNVYNPRSAVTRKDEYRRTLVKQGATLGANSTIVCGTTVGRYAFVGAGAVINRDVPDFAFDAVRTLSRRRSNRCNPRPWRAPGSAVLSQRTRPIGGRCPGAARGRNFRRHDCLARTRRSRRRRSGGADRPCGRR